MICFMLLQCTIGFLVAPRELHGLFGTEEGDQQRFWKLTRKFAEGLAERMEGTNIVAVRVVACHPCMKAGCC